MIFRIDICDACNFDAKIITVAPTMRATNSPDLLVIPSGRTRPADYDACDVHVQVHNARQRTAAMQLIGRFRMWVDGRCVPVPVIPRDGKWVTESPYADE